MKKNKYMSLLLEKIKKNDFGALQVLSWNTRVFFKIGAEILWQIWIFYFAFISKSSFSTEKNNHPALWKKYILFA